jgi:predicted PurR-regulated permease PerM
MNKIKDIAIIILFLTVVSAVIYFLYTKEPSSVVIPQELIHQIDSLKAKNSELEQNAKAFDSIINRYNLQIELLDSEIVYNQTKIDTAKKKISIKINKVKGYTSDEVDSFFKDRYNY